MHDVSLAILWHQHQPYYPDDVAGKNPMPWVRLHGAKDYWGMAMLLAEVPELHCAINLVPSLVKQILAYTDEGHQDEHLRISRLPADALAEGDLLFLLDNFFMAHAERMIEPFPRYRELYRRRGLGVDPAARAIKRFTPRDVLDLQCWSNLAWMHPLAFERDADLAEFRRKGQHWSEDEKHWLLDKQMELLGEVIPLHRKLADRGQVELTTTPFYHPILPLLCDRRLAREAMPGVALPERLDGYPADVAEHLQRAVAYHERVFGHRPRGLWPSEGSVCQSIVADVADAGIQWIATDEEILSASTNGWVARDQHGLVRNPEMLYRPWRVEQRGKSLQIIFRDHAMSDQIGFVYHRMPAAHAVDDFLGKVEAIGRATTANAGHRPTLLSIILDGENCWEYYPEAGVEFLRDLYRRVASHPKITPVRAGDYLEKYPASDKIGHLFAGSWIGHNFRIWIGHQHCNHAWDLLDRTRSDLVAAEAKLTPAVRPETLRPDAVSSATEPIAGQRSAAKRAKPKVKSPVSDKRPRPSAADAQRGPISAAWEELYIAEGSDWFWWFSDDHSSAQDALFDELFRKHLQNVYALVGLPIPPELSHPIGRVQTPHRLHTEPTSLLDVKIDGRQTYFEWLNAGRYTYQTARGTMSMADISRLSDVYFGFDDERLLVRLDGRGRTAAEALADIDAVRIAFFEPEGFEVLVARPGSSQPLPRLYHRDVPVSEAGVSAAADAIFELSIPWRTLAVAPDDPVHFCVELLQTDNPVERLPPQGAIETVVPSPDFEQILWQA